MIFNNAPFKSIITIDFETYWDRAEYTLSKMTTEEYIRDPRFQAHGACLHEFGTDKITQWYTHDELKRVLKTYDWSKTAVLAHNAQFDVSIMEWVYDVHPCFILDSLSMARALRGVEVGNSLSKLAKDFNLPDKGQAVNSTEKLRTEQLSPQTLRELAEYCAHDVFLCEQIFSRLLIMVDNDGVSAGTYPVKELRLIDMTLKMYTRPVLELDQEMLRDAIEDERTTREGLLQRLQIDEAELASNPRFAEILRGLGVEPPMKTSKITGKPALALAKSDALFQALLHGDNEEVRLLCEARLKVKSTTERTRAQRFLDISKRGRLPVPLSYYGAKSGRWAAAKGSAINMQNLKRGSFLRKAIMAPAGHQLVVGDLSQIEPRVLAWLSDYEDMLRIFQAGGDPYAAFGSQMFNIPGMTKESHPDLRQSAKSALLGCGYGLGWSSFAGQLLTGFLGAPPVRYDKAFAKKLGVDMAAIEKFMDNEDYMRRMAEIPHTCTEGELLIHCVAAKRIIDIYRATAWPVVAFWELCDSLLRKSLVGGEEVEYKCLVFRKGEIVLPNGMRLLYPDLRLEESVNEQTGKKEKQYVYGADATKLYAGKITNNVTQALARIVMTDGMLRVSKRYFVAGTVHDEQIAVVPDEEVADAKTWVLSQMTVEPSYMPGIPLAADGGAHRRYGMAKN
jgi:DNA polymerase